MNGEKNIIPRLGRRDFLKAATASALLISARPRPANATPESTLDAIGKATGSREPVMGRVNLTLPEIAENGSTVSLKVDVESPMTTDDYVQSVHIFADGNPLPEVADYYFGPHNGVAKLSIRMRLMQTQNVIAVAKMNNGDTYMASRMIKVTIGGCGG
ncbi:MAG: thiosulfate oxidation carrier protein SoxY [Rhodospirillaceae bacterium]|nr:thiosulfate oxidation carrier protein SoxY [Rhodospirillaceae bacterium]